VKAKSMSPILS
jgi:CubicO group peptidase (beta-lactamase class C family)